MNTPGAQNGAYHGHVTPPEEPERAEAGEAINDRRLLVGAYPFKEWLAVIPLTQAKKDVDLIRALSHSNTLGMVRKNPEAWALVAAAWEDDDEREGDVSALPDGTPFNGEEWFGQDTYYYMIIPSAQLRTAELCPEPVLHDFGREDHAEAGLDYEQATWLSKNDRHEIEQRLTDLGYEIVQDDELLEAYYDA